MSSRTESLYAQNVTTWERDIAEPDLTGKDLPSKTAEPLGLCRSCFMGCDRVTVIRFGG